MATSSALSKHLTRLDEKAKRAGGLRHLVNFWPYEERQKKRSEESDHGGLDLGERRHRYCALGKEGKVLGEGSLSNTRAGLKELSERYPGALVVMEAGSHSPWVSRIWRKEGCEVIGEPWI